MLAITPRVECEVYRPRRPEATPLYRLLESRYDPVKGAWEDRFEDRYGFWRGMVDGAVARYLDCGIFESGFARLHCGGCRRDVLVAFSCKGRGLCPSCGAKRGAAAAARLREEVLEAVGHAQWVFTVPKMLRPYFLRHRELLGDLCRAAWDTVREMLAAGAAEEIRPGMVAVVQTFGERVNFHPHVHAIASRGGWRKDGTWVPVAHADPGAAEKVFRHHVLSFLRKRGLIDEERVQLLLSWRHRGFSVHNSVVVEPEDPAAVERLIRYVMRPPVALERLHYDEAAGVAEICPRPGSNDEPGGKPREHVDADELVARVIAQVPDPRRHLIHAYGWYANAARAKREAERDPAFGADRGPASPLGVVRRGDRREQRGFRRSGAPRRTPALGRPDPPDLRSGSARLLELRRLDEDRRVYHRPQGDPRDSGLDAQERRCGVPARLAPPATSRSPGRGRRSVEGPLEQARAAQMGIFSPTVEVYRRTLELRARLRGSAARGRRSRSWRGDRGT
ncbi:MAG: transposase [Thermoanaerobaculia bacterium]